MGHQTVEPGIILDAGQITVVLNGHQRVALEGFQSKGVAGGAEGLCIKDGIISVKELLDDVEYSGLTSSRCPIEYHELLKFLGLSGHDGSNRPFNFVAFLWSIERGDQLFVSSYPALLQRIAEALAGIVFFGSFRVGKYQFFIEHVEAVFHLLLAVFVPSVDYPGLRIPHVKDLDVVVKTLAVFLGVSIQFAVYELNRILLIRRP